MWPLSLTLWAFCAVSLSQNLESMNTMEILTYFGTQGENHEVVTEDGYILTMHRLQPKSSNNKPPVLMQHGLMGTSEAWVLMGPRSDLAFLLQDIGYDVWLGNIRGTPYGDRHVNKTKKDREFWEYSFHEMGYYDVPAMIDYILNLTKKPDLYYIGHSMGTTMSYITCATRPEYNEKIRAIFSLAPVAFMSNILELYRKLAIYRRQIYKSFMDEQMYEVFPRIEWMRKVLADMCRDGSSMKPLCVNMVYSICGYDDVQLNTTILPLVAMKYSSTSANTIMHYAQNMESGEFQWYDLGKEKNLEVYGSTTPPDYNLALITAPVVLHYSKHDLLSHEKDVNRLANLLPNLVGKFLVPFKYFNHIDYMWSKDVKELLYNDMINMMNRML